MNREITELIHELSIAMIKEGMTGQFEIGLDRDDFYRLQRMPFGYKVQPWEEIGLPRPQGFHEFLVNAPGGAIKFFPKDKMQYKEYNEDDKYPF